MIRVQKDDFDIAEAIETIKKNSENIGAIVSFTGIVREFSDQKKISKMLLEHYPGMTESILHNLEKEANERWPLISSLITHRYGELKPNDNIVLVITASAHRQAAFEAASFLMDQLKTNAPFWKKETVGDKSVWVEATAQDEMKAKRWR